MLTNTTNIYFVCHALSHYAWADDATILLTQIGRGDFLAVLNSLKNILLIFASQVPTREPYRQLNH